MLLGGTQILAMAFLVGAQQQFVISELVRSSDCSGDPVTGVIAYEPVGVCSGQDMNGDWIPDTLATLELEGDFAFHRFYNGLPDNHSYACCATSTVEVRRQSMVEFYRCDNSSSPPGFWTQKRLVTLDSWRLDIYKMKNCTFSFSTVLAPLDICQTPFPAAQHSTMQSCNGSGITISNYETLNCTGPAKVVYYPAVTSGPCNDGPSADPTMVPRAKCLPSTTLTPPVQGLCPSNESNASNATAVPNRSRLVITSASPSLGFTWVAAAVMTRVVSLMPHF
ncbi:unnamed protein product [Cladocopium goreaui]|uniref:Uncharacterized protein n=1 Tax=Cladocopium goreaui TaxID=2562237 RepID=A0A9P1DBJ9_9DINO|nr:unnamed protein product [Cladocopium goreaui]